MSFFFAKAATAPSKATHAPKSGGLNPPTASMRRNAGTLNRLNCAVCPLNNAPVNSPKLPPTLAGDTQIYFLGTAPGKHEDGSGKPFTGRVAKILRDCLPEGARCSFDYVIRDRTPKDRPPAFTEIECCRTHIIKSIEQAKPKLIVGLGPVPLHWVLGSNDLVGMRGRMFAVKLGQHSCYFMATYAPAHVLEKAYDKAKPLRGKFGNCLAMDISRAFKFANSGLRPDIATLSSLVAGIRCFSGSSKDHFSQLMGLLQQAKQAPIKAIDLETKGLRPFAADGGVMTAAISFNDTHFSFAIGHPKTQWADPQLMAILEEFRVLLMDGTMKVAHNAPFELEWLIWLFGKSVVNHAVWHDSMVQAHLLDERRGKAHGNDHGATYQSLDFLVKQHFGLAYKASFKVNKKDMSKSDLGETLIYNAVDTKVTLRLFHHQERLLKKHNSYEAYLDAVPRQCSVALMQTLGIGVDQVEVKRLQKKLNRQVAVLDQQIAELDVVKQYNADHKEKFNPASDRECLIIFRDYLKAPEVELKLKPWEVFNFNVPSEAKRKFATGEVPEYSTSKATLSKINHPLAALVPTRRTSAKNLSTYCDQLEIGVGDLVYPDGKIHCNFNTTFTETGRLSSDKPNMQNIPHRENDWLRRQIIPPKGYVLLAFDYGQLEACVAAMCSRDRVLVKALWEDYDIHMDFAKRVHAVFPSALIDGDMKELRSRTKNKLVFPAFFGAADESIAGYMNMPLEPITQLMQEFWGTYTGLKRWQDEVMRGYYKNGYVTTYNGRRRCYPLKRNQAINHPVQGTACEIVCEAMNRLSYLAATERMWHLHPLLNIHDDLTLAVPDDDAVIEEAIKVVYGIMLTPSYECVNVPLSVTASIGRNWYDMAEYKKYWSHRDLQVTDGTT